MSEGVMWEFGGRSEIGRSEFSESSSANAGYCLSPDGSALSVRDAVSRIGEHIELRVDRGTHPSGKVVGVYSQDAAAFIEVEGSLINLGHVGSVDGRTGRGGAEASLVERLSSLPSHAQIYMPAASISSSAVEGIATHPSALMVKVGDSWCNINHVAEINYVRPGDAFSAEAARGYRRTFPPRGEKIEVSEVVDVLAELGSQSAVEVYTPAAVPVKGRLLGVHADNSALMLEVAGAAAGEKHLVNLAHVGTVTGVQEHRSSELWSRREEDRRQPQSSAPIRSLGETLRGLTGRIVHAETPFSTPCTGTLESVSSENIGQGFLLQIDGRKVPLNDVATLQVKGRDPFQNDRLF